MAKNTYPTAREKFIEHHKKFSDNDLMIELLWKLHLNNDKLDLNNDKQERIRSNTSTMVWFLIVLPIVFGILIFLFGLGSLV